MGGALAVRLLGRADLTVLDLNPAAVDRMVATGGKRADSAAALGRQTDVLLCLPRSSDVKRAVFGAGGLAEGLSPGKLVIDRTSGFPAVTAGIARRLAALGVAMADASVAGGVPAAKAGWVTGMGSGPSDAWVTAETVLRKISPKGFHCSDRVGDGQAMKLVNNAIGAGYGVATLELAALGRRFDLGLREISDRLNAGVAIKVTTDGMLAALDVSSTVPGCRPGCPTRRCRWSRLPGTSAETIWIPDSSRPASPRLRDCPPLIAAGEMAAQAT
jgi:3-hydroxyisobutyrate dehydrogenase